MCRTRPERSTTWVSTLFLTAILLAGFALRVAYLTVDRFHADEALYAGWALRILDDDPLLLQAPVDKPPLYLYLLAASMRVWGHGEVAARLPNLAASMLDIALIYALGRRLYGRETACWAAFFIAFSPFEVLFARTVFTDPLLVTFTLAALYAIATGHWLWAGASTGLAFAAKQHAIVLIPLVLVVGWIQAMRTRAAPSGTWACPAPPHDGSEEPARTRAGLAPCHSERSEGSPPLPPCHPKRSGGSEEPARTRAGLAPCHSERSEGSPPLPPCHPKRSGGLEEPARPRAGPSSAWVRRALAALLGFSLPFALVTWWDAQRWAIRPGYWQQSALSYGGLRWAPLERWGTRLVEWLDWARYLVGSPLLYAVLLAGGLLLVVRGWRRGRVDRRTRLDTAFACYGLAYVLLHTVLQFSVWDRYLLPLAPLACLLLARIVVPIACCSSLRQRSPQRGSCVGTRGARVGTRRSRAKVVLCALGVSVICLAALISGYRAARNGYPVGGEHWAYQGLDEIAAYLVSNAAPDAVLYHHWLRWHYSYYLYGTGFELRWWQSGQHLLREVSRTPDREQYIVLPDWRTLDPDAPGLQFERVYAAHRYDGTVSLQLYRIRVVPVPTSLLDGKMPSTYNASTDPDSPTSAEAT